MVTDELIGARLREQVEGLDVGLAQVDDVMAGIMSRARVRRNRVRIGAAAAGVAIAAGGVALVLLGGHVMPQSLPAGPVPYEPAVERPLPLWTGRLSGPAPNAPRPRATAFRGAGRGDPGGSTLRWGEAGRRSAGRCRLACRLSRRRRGRRVAGAARPRGCERVRVLRAGGTADARASPGPHWRGGAGRRMRSRARRARGRLRPGRALGERTGAADRAGPRDGVADAGEPLQQSLDAALRSEPWYRGSSLNEAAGIVVVQVRRGDAVEISRADTKVSQVWAGLPGTAGVTSRIEVTDHPIRDARGLADELAAYGRAHPDDLPVASAEILASYTIALHVPNYQQDRVRGRLNRLLAQEPWRARRPDRYGFVVVGDRPPRALPEWETPPPVSSWRFDLGLPTGDADHSGMPEDEAFGPRTRVGGYLLRLGYDEPCWALSTPNTLLAIPRWPAGWRAGVEGAFVLRDARGGVRAGGPSPWVTGEGRLGPGPTGGRCAGLPGSIDLGDGELFGAVQHPVDARLPQTDSLAAPRPFAWAEQAVRSAFPSGDPTFGGVYWHPVQRVLVVHVRAGSSPDGQRALRDRITALVPDPTVRWRYVETDRSLNQCERLEYELGALRLTPGVRGVSGSSEWGCSVDVTVVPGQKHAVEERLTDWFNGPLSHLNPRGYSVRVVPSYQPGDPGYGELRW